MTETKCPICGESVVKTYMTDQEKITSKCFNEYYMHVGSNLYKYKNPVGAWETNQDFLSNTKSSASPEPFGQSSESGISNKNP